MDSVRAESPAVKPDRPIHVPDNPPDPPRIGPFAYANELTAHAASNPAMKRQGRAKDVLSVLANWSATKGSGYFSIKRLAERFGTTRHSIKRALRKLLEVGYITRMVIPDGKVLYTYQLPIDPRMRAPGGAADAASTRAATSRHFGAHEAPSHFGAHGRAPTSGLTGEPQLTVMNSEGELIQNSGRDGFPSSKLTDNGRAAAPGNRRPPAPTPRSKGREGTSSPRLTAEESAAIMQAAFEKRQAEKAAPTATSPTRGQADRKERLSFEERSERQKLAHEYASLAWAQEDAEARAAAAKPAGSAPILLSPPPAASTTAEPRGVLRFDSERFSRELRAKRIEQQRLEDEALERRLHEAKERRLAEQARQEERLGVEGGGDPPAITPADSPQPEAQAVDVDHSEVPPALEPPTQPAAPAPATEPITPPFAPEPARAPTPPPAAAKARQSPPPAAMKRSNRELTRSEARAFDAFSVAITDPTKSNVERAGNALASVLDGDQRYAHRLYGIAWGASRLSCRDQSVVIHHLYESLLMPAGRGRNFLRNVRPLCPAKTSRVLPIAAPTNTPDRVSTLPTADDERDESQEERVDRYRRWWPKLNAQQRAYHLESGRVPAPLMLEFSRSLHGSAWAG